MELKKLKKIYTILRNEILSYNVPVVDLIKIQSGSSFKILIATILSARTQDKTTSRVCETLFSKVKTFDDLTRLSTRQIEKLIYPVGFYKNKAKQLKLLPEIIKNKFRGRIPETIDELIKLPGVGRKTANLVMSLALNKPAICVDTHVHRIMNRLGFVKTKSPAETEKALREKLPQNMWTLTNRIFVAFGQNTCRPINPACNICPINKFCESARI